MNQLVNHLQNRLNRELPGAAAQFAMAPPGRASSFDHERVRKAAVLILLFEENGEVQLPLILRPDYGGMHSGQISLPGGKKEKSDQSLQQTALREAEEEIGIHSARVKVLGRLSDLYIPPSNFLMTPFIAFTNSAPEFQAQPGEVEKILFIGLKQLIEQVKEKKTRQMSASSKVSLRAPYVDVSGHIMWGATAMVLSELVACLDGLKL